MTPEQARLAGLGPHSSAIADARADREQRLAHDEAQLREGGQHSAEVLSHHEGRPTVAAQSVTHGAPLPLVDTGRTEQQKYG